MIHYTQYWLTYCRLWENSKYVSRQLDKIGVSLSTALVNAGLTSFDKIKQKSPRELELVSLRYPYFNAYTCIHTLHILYKYRHLAAITYIISCPLFTGNLPVTVYESTSSIWQPSSGVHFLSSLLQFECGPVLCSPLLSV